jgi:two-component system OmpR family response regulator
MTQSTTAATILVVDDNRELCELMEVILCCAGYDVLTAGNGAEALRLARNTPRIDLLLSDVDMPHMRGDELATRFARLHPSAPVVFVSSSDGPIKTTEPFEFVTKPFTVAALRDSVRRVLRTRPAFSEPSRAT